MRVLAAVLAVLLLAAPAARADGDPASDVLLSQDVYYPYAPPTRADLRKALDGTVKAARDAGYPVKVALIAAPADLGAYPQLYNKPNEYATLLARELPGSTHGAKVAGQRILVVMPGGFGGTDLGDRIDEALAGIAIQAKAQSDGLAVAAMTAVARLATANGHEVEAPPEASLTLGKAKGGGGGGPSALLYALPVAAIFLVLALLGRRRSG